MEQMSLLTLSINAIATIVTTYVVTRISLGKPILFLGPSIRSAFRRYWLPLLAALVLVFYIFIVVRFLGSDKPPTRMDVVFIPLNVFGIFAYAIILLVELARGRRNRA